MLKKIKDLSDLIKITPQKNLIDDLFLNILEIIKKDTGLILKKDDFIIKNNILKIKSNSNIRFIIFLNLNSINKQIKDLNPNQNFIIEL